MPLKVYYQRHGPAPSVSSLSHHHKPRSSTRSPPFRPAASGASERGDSGNSDLYATRTSCGSLQVSLRGLSWLGDK